MSCSVAFVYKFYPFDPTEHALLRWLPRVRPDAQFFEFPANARKDPHGLREPDPSFLAFLQKHRPKQVWVWNNILHKAEVAACQELGAKVAGLMNSFVVYHGGHFPDQASYLDQVRSLDAYFVPHFGNVAPLQAVGVNALEMPFFYDPSHYRPLPRWLAPRNLPVLFVGSVSESAASNRRLVIEKLAKRVPVHLITFRDPKLPGVVWHRPTNRPFLLNWWKNRAALVLNIEDVGETYSPEVMNERFGTKAPPYAERLVFHGNHVFPAMGAGRVCLSEWSEPMLRFCEPGRDILAWRSPEEAADLALEALADPTRLARMGEAAYEKVRSQHTAERRIEEILRQMEGVSR